MNTVIVRLNRSTIESGNMEALMNEIKQSCSRYSEKDQERIRTKFNNFLEAQNLKRTYERITILEEILLCEKVFSFRELKERTKYTRNISSRTFYKVVKLMEEAGMLKRFSQERNNGVFAVTYYELKV